MSAARTAIASFALPNDDFPPGGQFPAGWVTTPGATAGWGLASDSYYRGPLSLKSADIGDSQSAMIEVTTTHQAGNVSFAWRVSSESNFDWLRFYVIGHNGNAPLFEASGPFSTWDTYTTTTPVPAGTHTFRWVYVKDSSISSGADAAWIDSVTLPPPAGGSTAPGAITGSTSAIGSTVATLGGAVSSNGATTNVTFQYGLTTGYGSTVTAAESPIGPGASGAAVSATLSNLACNTTYHYRVVAANVIGTTNGTDATFATGACSTVFAPGSTLVASATNATPTVVTTLAATCPASGLLQVSGSGESTALSTSAGSAFIGLAYSIARDSTATDNTNVVQSSALAVFNGDANRDFLNVQRVDSCTPSASYTYRLTAYRTTAATSASSFLWNGRLTARGLR